MLTVRSTPSLRDPILLCGFTGWADAASAASGALRYLLLKRAGTPVAAFDPDAIYNYTTTRPLTMIEAQGSRRIQWPSLELVAVEVPEAPRDLIILVGPEPDLRWREWVRTLLDYAAQLRVSAVLTFGAFLAQVHFAGPPALMGISSDQDMRAELRHLGVEDSNYQGPTGITTVILRAATELGIPAASLWVAAPSYLSSTSNPKLSAALLDVAEHLIDQDLWKGELETAGRDMELHIQDALSRRPDLVDFLNKLRGETQDLQLPDDIEVQIPDPEIPSQAAEPEELPSSAEILRALEDHLRRLKGDSDQGPDPAD